MLRSLNTLLGYTVSATDGDMGTVRNFYFDDQAFTVRYLVVNTAGFGQGPEEVLIAPHWIGRISWPEKKVHVNLRRETIKNSPEWDPEKPVNRSYEARLYDYYGRPVYWAGDAAPPEPAPKVK